MNNNKTGYYIQSESLVIENKGQIRVCYPKQLYRSDGVWVAENPLIAGLPLFVLQLLCIMVLTRLLLPALRPLRQPRIVAEILGGIMLGPSLLCQFNMFREIVFPFRNMVSLENVGNLALVFHMLLVGLELDLKPVIRVGKKAVFIALAGMIVALPVGWVLHRYYYLQDFHAQMKTYPTIKNGPIFWGIAIATTNFPDIARLLADFKLFNSEIGILALSAAIISDLFSWFLLLIGMATSVEANSVLSIGSTLAFIALCIFVVRPALSRIIHEKVNEDTDYSEYTGFVLAGILLFGLTTDACGSHSIVGPFVLGAIIPKGEFRNQLVDKLENFVPGILMPMFYLIMGLRVNLFHLFQFDPKDQFEYTTGTTMARLLGVIIVTFFVKILSTFVAGLIVNISRRDSLVLGVLLNTKGLWALIVLSSGRDIKALSMPSHNIIVVAICLMTAAVGPFLAIAYKSRVTASQQYKLNNIQSIPPNTEIRILACSHSTRNVSGIISLLEASNPTNLSPLHVFAVHLVELTGHTSAMLIVHEAASNTNTNPNDLHQCSPPQPNLHPTTDTSNANHVFEMYAQKRENVTVQSLTAVSAYNTMHEDICNLADDKRAALIIIPYHKQSITDGASKDSYAHLKSLNVNLLAKARCSVGVLVDCGLATSKIIMESTKQTHDNNDTDDLSTGSTVRRHLFAMFFFGGADDREALSYAWRMAGHPTVSLTVIRFILRKKQAVQAVDDDVEKDDEDTDDEQEEEDDDILEAMASSGRQKELDELYLDEFKIKSMNEGSIELFQKVVASWNETLAFINDMQEDYDLFVVGRRHGNVSTATTTLFEIMDEELGSLGDALEASNSTAHHTSIVVVQQGSLRNDELQDHDGGLPFSE